MAGRKSKKPDIRVTPIPDSALSARDEIPQTEKRSTARKNRVPPTDTTKFARKSPNAEVQSGPDAAKERILPIVGIGASAGGLEAFEKLFTNMPSDSGMAFVLVQHLDPTHKSILVELVKRYTSMNVFEVEDGMQVEPNCTYIIPPNRDMAILHGKLHLMEPAAPRGMRLPIDYFFRSLAEDQGERAIGIVLSGTGTEGAQGIRIIKGEGGMAMVQSPETAKYDGMPRNAIATGMADYILSPEEMPLHLVNYVQHTFRQGPLQVTEPPPKTEKDLLSKVFILLRAKTGHDFSSYKQNTISRRVNRRMSMHQITRLNDYVRYLQQNSAEVEILFKELLIGVTSFFRDPEAWDVLHEKVIPRLFEGRPPDKPVRVWIPGCSTGEEAYSISILLQEYLEEHKTNTRLQIFATDIDMEAIEKARLGVFPESIAVDVPHERLARFFNHEENTYQIKRSIRDQVVFAAQNVAKDPPFSRLDLISCRNLLIYMQPELQKRILPLFHYALNQNGFLFLGNSESIGEFTEFYTTLDRKWKIFQCKRIQAAFDQPIEIPLNYPREEVAAAHPVLPAKKGNSIKLRELVERVMLQRYTPTSVIVNEKGEVLYVHGSTGMYLELPSGETNLNILSLAREGLRVELSNALRKVKGQKQEVRYEGLRVKVNEVWVSINLTVSPILEPAEMLGLVMIVFEEAVPRRTMEEEVNEDLGSDRDKRIAGLERALQAKEEYLQTTIEELETSNEELKSTNEELQSSIEELQSTNEELETSKEELQSVNEELVTVNTELQKKIDLLSQSYNDMNNLLASTEIGTIFLDQHQRIQRFTPSITQIIPLIQSDVGRPVSDITTNLIYNRLPEDVDEVLKTLVFKEIEIQTVGGRWYWMRIMPYRTLENVIEGVVITFVNITEQKRVQHELNKLTYAVEQSHSIVMITDVNGNVEYVNPRFTQVTGYTLQDILGKNPNILNTGGQSQEFFQKMQDTLNSGETWQGKLNNRKKDGSEYWESASISPVKDETGNITHYIAVKEDLSDHDEDGKKE